MAKDEMMKQRQIYLLILTLLVLSSNSLRGQHFDISENQRHLVDAEGKPFFYLGDTAWELFHRLSLAEAKQYFSDRSAKGFTVIQAVVLAQLGGLDDPNANGDVPLVDRNPAYPNPLYYLLVDSMVAAANEEGLVVGMLPTWGSYWSETNGNQKIFDEDNAYSFANFLAQRYRDAEVIWILGGDENITTENERKIIEAMASGIEEADPNACITFHPRGPGLSSDYFHTAPWLDFNMYQSSHAARHHDNGLYAEHDLQLSPAKPTLDGEPRYEGIPVGFYMRGSNWADRFHDHDARQAAYWSVLSGACGHTYGNNNIWQMWDVGRDPILGANVPWHQAIHHPGSAQMKYLRRLFEARPFHLLQPNKNLILDHTSTMGGKVKGSLAEDRSFAVIYSPLGLPFTVDQSLLSGQRIRSAWYDPRYGVSYETHVGNTFGKQTFVPPSSGAGHDWVLLLDIVEKNYDLP